LPPGAALGGRRDGTAGSFIGGLLANPLFGDGLELRPSGIAGILVGALTTKAIWIHLDPTKALRARRSRPRRSNQVQASHHL